MATNRTFTTGATRDTDEGKADYEGFLSPLVMERFGQYMTKHRKLPDGTLRASDNWQRGIPQEVYVKSAWRHFVEFWRAHRGWPVLESIEDSLCALLFNLQGYLHELLKAKALPYEAPRVDISQGSQPMYLDPIVHERNVYGIVIPVHYTCRAVSLRPPCIRCREWLAVRGFGINGLRL